MASKQCLARQARTHTHAQTHMHAFMHIIQHTHAHRHVHNTMHTCTLARMCAQTYTNISLYPGPHLI